MIYVAIPAYECRVGVETVRALLNETLAAHVLGFDLQVAFVPGTSAIWQARNQIAAEFMAASSDPDDRLVMIDADVAWEVGQLIRLATQPVEFVGGCYRYKAEPEDYPIGWLNKPELWADPETGLLEVAHLPGGFLSIKRSVLEKLTAAFPGPLHEGGRAYEFQGRKFQAFFHVPPGGGEDGAFCTDWRSIGGQVWLDPDLTLSHCEATKKYTGNIGNWLKAKMA